MEGSTILRVPEPRKLTLIPYRTDQRNLSHHLRRPFMCIVIAGYACRALRGIACARRARCRWLVWHMTRQRNVCSGRTNLEVVNTPKTVSFFCVELYALP